jgi:hypothetical protein
VHRLANPLTETEKENRPMARKQMNIPGTERTEIHDIEVAAEAYREISIELADIGKQKTARKAELLALLKAHKVKLYRYHDGDGEEIEVAVDDEPRVKLRKTGEAEAEVGEGIPELSVETVSQGLINQALKAQDDAGVAEDEDGDVLPPDKAAPKAKKPRAKKAKA